MRRVLAAAMLAALLGAACGEAGPLDGVGRISERWVAGATTTSSTIPVEPVGTGGEGLVRATDVLWFNDDLSGEALGAPEAVIAAVWRRRTGSRFVQASRREIAAALPTIRFPRLVPSDVRWITSQLVYDEATGLLDPDTSAAFGLWVVEPYTANEGRLAVLRIGAAPPGSPPGRGDVVPVVVPDGLSLSWTDAGLRYELFCRSTISEELCRRVATSTVPMEDLLPGSGT